jgi:hypothetical protein
MRVHASACARWEETRLLSTGVVRPLGGPGETGSQCQPLRGMAKIRPLSVSVLRVFALTDAAQLSAIFTSLPVGLARGTLPSMGELEPMCCPSETTPARLVRTGPALTTLLGGLLAIGGGLVGIALGDRRERNRWLRDSQWRASSAP